MIEVVSNKDVKIINNYAHKPVLEEIEDLSPSNELVNGEVYQESSSGNHQALLDSAYEEIIDKAQNEANEIIEKAKEQARQLEKDAKVKGRKDGLREGKEEGLQQVAQLKQDLEDDIAAFQEESKAFYRNMEPKIAEIVKNLVSNMVGIQKFDKETLLFVIRKGLEEVDVQGDLIIKVSAEDFDEVIMNKSYLEENMSSQLHLEILKDNKMSKNDCLIETNLGNINCSLNDRMKGLLKQLSLIEKSFGSHES